MKKININCPIGTTGYGITSLNIVKNLYQKNIDISLFLIGNNIELNFPEEKTLIQQLHKNTESFDYNAPCLKIWHQNDLALKIGNGDYYTFPFFEIDTLSEKDKHHLNYCDHIFVASEWAKTILINNDIKKPIYVAPLGVDQNIFRIPEDKLRIKDNYIFFHIGKWEKRKGQDFLIKAFESAFDINDKVELWLLPHNPFLTKEQEDEWFKLIENSKLKDKIKVYNRLPTQQHLAQFIFSCDCGVFLSRAEGWNNEIPECMALNKPIITTNYSAHTEYCDSNNSFLVDIDELELANDGKWFFGEGKWAKLAQKQLEQTVEYMKYVYSNNITTNEDGLKTANRYSWNNTCSIIDDIMMRNNSYANTK
jgi:glycosyltransferase involved in cell wall biosynthesis